MDDVFGYLRWWRGGVKGGLNFLMRELFLKGLRTPLITHRSSLKAERCRLKNGDQREPGGVVLHQIGLKPAGFMGSGFAGGVKWWCIKRCSSRARRLERMVENGTGESRGLFGACFMGFYRGLGRENC